MNNVVKFEPKNKADAEKPRAWILQEKLNDTYTNQPITRNTLLCVCGCQKFNIGYEYNDAGENIYYVRCSECNNWLDADEALGIVDNG